MQLLATCNSLGYFISTDVVFSDDAEDEESAGEAKAPLKTYGKKK